MTDTEEQILLQIQDKFFPQIHFSLVTKLKEFDLYWLVDFLAMMYRNNFPFPTTEMNFESFLIDVRRFEGRNYLELQKELFGV